MEIPSFHDGYVTGLKSDGRGSAQIFLSNVDGQPFILSLSGVKHLWCDDFRAGNIVYSVKVRHRVHVEVAEFEDLFHSPHPSVATEYVEEHNRFVQEQQRLIADGEAMLVVITPSYGCTLLALCSTADLLPE
jgi:hypothetical protein